MPGLNATSTFVTGHYHGTNLSFLQFPTHENQGYPLPDLQIEHDGPSGSLRLFLPKEYTQPPKLFLENRSQDYWAPWCNVNVDDITEFMEFDKGMKEIVWMEHAVALENDELKG